MNDLFIYERSKIKKESFDFRFLILDSWFLILDSRFSILDSWFSILDSRLALHLDDSRPEPTKVVKVVNYYFMLLLKYLVVDGTRYTVHGRR
jgi:hypothetical protein